MHRQSRDAKRAGASGQLAGKVAVVTGASSGVGRAIAEAFGQEAARVALIARGEAGLEAAARAIREAGAEAMVLPLDVSDADAVEAAADRVIARWGCIDIWVNDAMVSVFAPVTQIRPEEYRRVMEVNYLGYVHGTLAALKHMRPQNSGVIMQIGSALAYRSIPLQSAYCASKAAIRAFTDSLRSELLHEGSAIEITHLHLPAVNTPQFEVVRSRLPEHPHPVPPLYQPEVIARAAVWAALHPQRELWIGTSTIKAILGQRVIPGLLDRYLANKAWSTQHTTDVPPHHPVEHAADNLNEPLPGDRGAHGPFDHEAESFSLQLWARMHARELALGAAALLFLGIAATRVLPSRSASLRRARALPPAGGGRSASGKRQVLDCTRST
jgi:NAD(P)-dependent dehydrogenase (short-subunit alcohol dehydrogenase family)